MLGRHVLSNEGEGEVHLIEDALHGREDHLFQAVLMVYCQPLHARMLPQLDSRTDLRIWTFAHDVRLQRHQLASRLCELILTPRHPALRPWRKYRQAGKLIERVYEKESDQRHRDHGSAASSRRASSNG